MTEIPGTRLRVIEYLIPKQFPGTRLRVIEYFKLKAQA